MLKLSLSYIILGTWIRRKKKETEQATQKMSSSFKVFKYDKGSILNNWKKAFYLYICAHRERERERALLHIQWQHKLQVYLEI